MSERRHPGKDVIYIDVDDEITAIVDKVKQSEQKIVALVLPKRAAVFQSIVNMKLLKRATEHAKKNLVLITSEAGLLPLAGTVGLHVAKSLQSKPEVPDTPAGAGQSAEHDMAEEAAEEIPDEDAPLDATKTIGELSGDEDGDTIQIDDDAPSETSKGKKVKGLGKRFKIPNFNRFRIILIAGSALLALLIVGGVYAFFVMPKAQVVIKTDSSSVTSAFDVTLKPGDNVQLNADQSLVPAIVQSVDKTAEQTIPATGQINNGQKATGQVKLSLTDCAKSEVTVPAGTGVAASGKTFITKTSLTLQSVKVGNQCKNSSFPDFSTGTVGVTAQSGGSTYNIAPSDFSVAGFSNVTGKSSAAMSGGTDDIIKVLSQADVDAAKQKLSAVNSDDVVRELTAALEGRGLMVIKETFTTGTPEITQDAKVGDQVENVTIKQKVTYTLWGVKATDLQQVVAAKLKDKIDLTKQSITDYGFKEAVFNISNQTPEQAVVNIQLVVVAGPDLKIDDIKKQVAGLKAHNAQELLGKNPGVTDVNVTYSPFWVSTIPKKTDKITVIIEKPTAAPKSDAQTN